MLSNISRIPKASSGHDPEDAFGILKMFESIERSYDISPSVVALDKTAVTDTGFLLHRAADSQSVFTNIETDDFACTARGHLQRLIAVSTTEIEDRLITNGIPHLRAKQSLRSEERRVGKECRSR